MITKKENYLRAIRRENPQWVPYGRESVKLVYPPVIERAAGKGKDDFGVEWDINELAEGGTYPVEGEFVITDIERFREQLIFPKFDEMDWSIAAKEAAAIDRDEYLIEGVSEFGVFERAYLLMGMENALMAYYTNPNEMYELCSAIADYKIELIKKYHAEVGFDILWYGDDWGTQSNLFISPDLWRQIVKPNTQRVYNCIKELGVIIDQHSCGKIESVFSDICEMGADIINPCQPCNDLKGLKQRFGDRICFFGGVDSQFVLDNDNATPEDVEAEVRKRIYEMSLPNGGYIISPSHSVPYDKAKLDAMERTAAEHGRKVYGG